jgi:5-methylcytosine-specific restriction endonuclease McrA
VDHFYPLSGGNALCVGNAIILCRSCNSKKGSKIPEQFFTKDIFDEALLAIAVSRILKNGVY